MKRNWILGLVALAVLTACGTEATNEAEETEETTEVAVAVEMTATPDPTDAPAPTEIAYTAAQIQEGQLDYGIYCVACHGPDAQGLPGLGVTLVESQNLRGWTDDEAHAMIVAGRAADDPASISGVAMPARGGFPNLSDTQIYNIIAYLRSIAVEG